MPYHREMIGEKIRRLRTTKKITQTGLANIIKTSQGHISEIENNYVEPTLHTIHRIARALDIQFDTLIKGTE